ncbi:MAG TPA: hypothetical protein VMT67_16650 [Terriglobales bacterium]|nr:hypothetical protein [Terriglobales bacterium]
MKRLAIALVLTSTAFAQSGTEPPARAALPPDSKATVNLNDSESAHKARALLDQTIETLGGKAYLTYETRSESGRYYPLYHGHANGTGLQYNYFLKYPDKDRFEVLKAGDLHIIPGTIDIGGVKSKKVDLALVHNGDKGYEVTYKGTAAQDKLDLKNYLRRREHSPEWVFRKWLNDPTVALFYDGLEVVDSKPTEGVTLLNSKNDSVKIWIDQLTHYPVKISYSWRDEKDKQMNTEEEVFDHYKPVDGIMTPTSFTRYFNGEMSQQRFIATAKYNMNLPETMFDANVTYDPEAPRKKH